MLRYFLCFSFCILVVWTSSLQKYPSSTVKHVGGRIINGERAVLGQFPWLVEVLVAANDSAYSCGGALLSDEWILTAAQCIENAYMADVYMGTVDFALVPMLSIADVFIHHEEYNASTLVNDIGVVKLRKRLLLDENTSPIALSSEPLAAGMEVTVSGWGETKDNDFSNQYLYYMNVTTIENSACAQVYGESAIVDSMVCTSAGDPPKGGCIGDSGSPAFVYDADNNPAVVAIVNLYSGRGCESLDPTGLTRTADYIDWIKEKTGI